MAADTTSTITVHIDRTLKDQLDNLRRREKITLTGFVENAITEKLHRMGLLSVPPEDLSRLVSHS